MRADPRLYRKFLLLAPQEGRVQVLAERLGVSPASIYRFLHRAIKDQALVRLGECAYSTGPHYSVFVDHIDSAWGEVSDSHSLLSEPRLSRDNQRRAVRLLPGWISTKAECTWVILPPVPPDLATRLLRWGRSWRYQEKSTHGTAQFYVGKNGASVVLHMNHRDYPDGLEAQVPKFQRSEFRSWIGELLEAYPGLKVLDRPIFHPDPKAHESATPLPTGELVKRIAGVAWVPREKVGAATEINSSPPGPALETAGIEEARAVARAPFVLESLRQDLAQLKETVDGLGNAMRDLVGILKPKPEQTPPPPREPDWRGYG